MWGWPLRNSRVVLNGTEQNMEPPYRSDALFVSIIGGHDLPDVGDVAAHSPFPMHTTKKI